ncbi:hypothetical protein ACSAGD_09755 [Paramicrobacterium sp. CJ85]|uniref:hypothetical protein n=1 Tax=Paramicrobacterium sp. CJ85 TaxID=3445355 RepID=UPI003F5E52A5
MANNSIEQNDQKPAGLNRRTMVTAAAWSVPVIATAVATPAASASTTNENVSISSSCYGINIMGFGQSFPQFHITAEGAPIEVGSTFILNGGGLGNLTFGGYGDFLEINVLSGKSAQITVRKPIPAGESLTLQVTGIAAALALTNFTLSTGAIIGNANTRSDDDAATQTLTGVGMFGIFVGHCG